METILIQSRLMDLWIRWWERVNRERLAEYLGELQRKEDTNDRYVAALRGETLTRNPHQRIQPAPQQNARPEQNK